MGNVPRALTVGDWNGDGVLDLAIVIGFGPDTSVAIFLGNGSVQARIPATIKLFFIAPPKAV